MVWCTLQYIFLQTRKILGRNSDLFPPDCSIEERLAATGAMYANTCQADVTGHPAMSVPCGMAAGLPIGMMLIGRHFDDATVIAASQAFESLGDWKKM